MFWVAKASSEICGLRLLSFVVAWSVPVFWRKSCCHVKMTTQHLWSQSTAGQQGRVDSTLRTTRCALDEANKLPHLWALGSHIPFKASFENTAYHHIQEVLSTKNTSESVQIHGLSMFIILFQGTSPIPEPGICTSWGWPSCFPGPKAIWRLWPRALSVGCEYAMYHV